MFDVRPTRDLEEFGRALYGIGQYFGGPPTEEQLEAILRAAGARAGDEVEVGEELLEWE